MPTIYLGCVGNEYYLRYRIDHIYHVGVRIDKVPIFLSFQIFSPIAYQLSSQITFLLSQAYRVAYMNSVPREASGPSSVARAARASALLERSLEQDNLLNTSATRCDRITANNLMASQGISYNLGAIFDGIQ